MKKYVIEVEDDYLTKLDGTKYYRLKGMGKYIVSENMLNTFEPLDCPNPSEWKTDHGYMWLCPECGMIVHSDYLNCVRCGYVRSE